MFSSQELQKIRQLINNAESEILILTHYNPDGDAIGSALGMKHFLKKLGKDASVIVPNEYPKFLKWLPMSKEIAIAEHREKFTEIAFRKSALIFCLDFNTAFRINNLEQKLIQSPAVKILIDHHQQPDEFDFVYSDTTQPATCQMVYKFIDALGETDKIDETIATCLYTGILTDTGSFRFRNTTSETHRIIADLIDKGAQPDEIASNVLDSNTPGRIKLLSTVLNSMEYIEEKKTVILSLTREKLKEYSYQKGDTDGFVNYGLSVIGVKFVGFFMEDLKQDYIKISFRSKDDFDVNQFARQHFNGGGHINAAGGRSELSLRETVEKFKQIVNETIIN
ncbi:MAG: bifunctional oligoribonuclease/PAP phosphatase NrnA [Flavobacteriaceae bacterium]|jgi:phosphoesterase RecJ-like protein|nr:bifunctional oligoribonuclease/PAP phosphatase NrnA [Flavobacteriaceae bacterium]